MQIGNHVRDRLQRSRRLYYTLYGIVADDAFHLLMRMRNHLSVRNVSRRLFARMWRSR